MVWNFRAQIKKQLDFGFEREFEDDRNFNLGGRSFYFFDFDDNVAFLSTNIVLFHKKTKEERLISTVEYYQFRDQVGVSGSAFEDFEFNYDDQVGSYRYFRDKHFSFWEKITGRKQQFENDVVKALKNFDLDWKAPSWNFFYHATFNQRPISIITARGHGPETIKKGIHQLVSYGHLPKKPNFLSVYPVTHKETRELLGDSEMKLSVAELKKKAIKHCVYEAIKQYGYNDHHRFGMSDDDPSNITLIKQAMGELKNEFPKMSFFVIDTNRGNCIKREINLSDQYVNDKKYEQLNLGIGYEN